MFGKKQLITANEAICELYQTDSHSQIYQSFNNIFYNKFANN